MTPRCNSTEVCSAAAAGRPRLSLRHRSAKQGTFRAYLWRGRDVRGRRADVRTDGHQVRLQGPGPRALYRPMHALRRPQQALASDGPEQCWGFWCSQALCCNLHCFSSWQNYAKALVSADRTALFMLDSHTNEIYARVFDVGDSSEGEGGARPPVQQKEIRSDWRASVSGVSARWRSAYLLALLSVSVLSSFRMLFSVFLCLQDAGRFGCLK